MRPEVDATLQAVIERLMGEVQPALPTAYGQGNLALMVMLLAALPNNGIRRPAA